MFSLASAALRTRLSDGTQTLPPLALTLFAAAAAAAAILAEDRRLMMSLMEGTLVDSYSMSRTLGMLSLKGVGAPYLRVNESPDNLGDPTLLLLDMIELRLAPPLPR